MNTNKAQELYRVYLGLTEEQEFTSNLLGMAAFMLWGLIDSKEDDKEDDDPTKIEYYPVDILKAIDDFDTELNVKVSAKESFFVQLGAYNADALINISARTIDEGLVILRKEFPNITLDSLPELVAFLRVKITSAKTKEDAKALVGQALDEAGVNLDEFD